MLAYLKASWRKWSHKATSQMIEAYCLLHLMPSSSSRSWAAHQKFNSLQQPAPPDEPCINVLLQPDSKGRIDAVCGCIVALSAALCKSIFQALSTQIASQLSQLWNASRLRAWCFRSAFTKLKCTRDSDGSQLSAPFFPPSVLGGNALKSHEEPWSLLGPCKNALETADC